MAGMPEAIYGGVDQTGGYLTETRCGLCLRAIDEPMPYLTTNMSQLQLNNEACFVRDY